MAVLKVIDGPETGTIHPLQDLTVYLGRSSECHVQIPSTETSRKHTVVARKDGAWCIQDNQSSNGTFLNGIRITSDHVYPFIPGDTVSIDTSTLVFLGESGKLPEIEIAGHTLLEIIGETNTTLQILARQESIARDVVIELVKPEHAQAKDRIGRFIQEARQAGKLSHPSLIKINNIAKTKDEQYYLSREHFGKPLLIKMKDLKKPEALQKVIEWAIQIAEALESAHAAGMLHQNMNLQSIRVDDAAGAKLLGIGIPRSFDNTTPTLTDLYYASPEQAMLRPCDGRSDLYSFGAVFYHALSGYPVFEGEPMQVAEWLKSDRPAKPLHHVASHVSEDLCAVFDKLVCKNPDERYATAADVASALSAAIKVTPATVEAAPKPATEPITKDTAAFKKKGKTSSVAVGSSTTGNISAKEKQTQKIGTGSIPGTRSIGNKTTRKVTEIRDGKFWGIRAGISGAATIVLVILFLAVLPAEVVVRDVNRELSQKTEEIEHIISEGDLRAAKLKYEEMLIEYQKYPELVASIKEMIAEVDSKIAAEDHYNGGKNALVIYQQLRQDSPRDYVLLRKELDKLSAEYSDVIKEDVDIEEQALAALAGGIVKRKIEDLENLALHNEFDEVFEKLEEFTSTYGKLPSYNKIEDFEKRTQATLDTKIKAMQKDVSDQITKGAFAALYASARETIKATRKIVKSKQMNQACDAMEQLINNRMKDSYEAACRDTDIACLNSRYDSAVTSLKNIRSALMDTEYEDRLKEKYNQIQELRKLETATKDRIRSAGNVKIGGKLLENEVVQKLMGGDRIVYLVGCDDTGIKISVGEAGATIIWKRLAGSCMAALYHRFTPSGNTAEQKSVEYYDYLIKTYPSEIE